jgi:thiol:disulfide interchange protein
MIPITVSYFTNHSARDRKSALRDVIVYALGIIPTFTAIGVTLAIVFGPAGINNFAASLYVNPAICTCWASFNFRMTRNRNGSAQRASCAAFYSWLGFYLLTGLFGAKLGELESFLPYPTEPSLMTVTANNGAKNAEAEWLKNDYEGALVKARAENKSVFIDFTGYTCTNCRWMEGTMFPKPKVAVEMAKFIKVQLFTGGEGEIYEKQQQLQEEKFNTVALPLYAIVDANGNTKATFPGLTPDKEEFVRFLKSGN